MIDTTGREDVAESPIDGLLDRADALILAAGNNTGNIAFQQSAIAQASGILREAMTTARAAAKELNDRLIHMDDFK